MGAFLLSKWYLDCISPSGEVFIGYSARLRWKQLAISYQSALIHDGQTRTRVSLRNGGAPQVTADLVQWDAPGIGVHGMWRAQAEPIEETLLSSPAGDVRWSCLMPKATARTESMAGFGYVEKLELSISPWKLPIEQLRWGRFLTPREAWVWIEWKGPVPRSLVLRNGRKVESARIEDDLISTDGAVLRLDCGLVLRNGALGETELRRFGRVAPVRMLAVKECKWRSRAILSDSSGMEESGWAIHELVEWPRG